MTFAEFWPVYVRAHSRRGTRVAHLLGTLGGWMLVGAAIAERRWWLAFAAVLIAYGLAWIAHFFCGAQHACYLRASAVFLVGRSAHGVSDAHRPDGKTIEAARQCRTSD